MNEALPRTGTGITMSGMRPVGGEMATSCVDGTTSGCQVVWPGGRRSMDLGPLLRPFGVVAPRWSVPEYLAEKPAGPCFLVLTDAAMATQIGLHATSEAAFTAYRSATNRTWWEAWRRRPIYRAVLPHLTFSGPGLEPIWVNDTGRAVAAWWGSGASRVLVMGLDIEAEIVRYRQGNPERVGTKVDRAAWGFQWERPNYLFDGQVDPLAPSVPWADRLGFFVAERWAELSGQPLLEPLPGGAKGLVVVTGDDDQAYLEKYAEQRELLGTTPMTYFLHPLTRHKGETLAQMGAQVDLGLHPDALECPDDYDARCREQTAWIEELCGKKVRLVRNHGFLNRGYLGHVPVWEEAGLDLDVNYPGVDGTALTGSFLPMRVRRLDGTWSTHYSLLTAFGDGMIYALNMSEWEAVRRIRRVVREIENGQPGVLVFNLHPQNVADTKRIHAEVVRLSTRPGWRAVGLARYLEWLGHRDSLRFEPAFGQGTDSLDPGASDLVCRQWTTSGWKRFALAAGSVDSGGRGH